MNKSWCQRKHYYSLYSQLKKYSTYPIHNNIKNAYSASYTKHHNNQQKKSINKNVEPPKNFQFFEDRRIVYSSYFEKERVDSDFNRRRELGRVKALIENENAEKQRMPISYHMYFKRSEESNEPNHTGSDKATENEYPYSKYQAAHIDSDGEQIVENEMIDKYDCNNHDTVKEDIRNRLEEYYKGELKPIDIDNIRHNLHGKTPGKDVEIARRFLGKSVGSANIEEDESEKHKAKYGTADPSVAVSEVPCGGCGALLHCRDPALPGFKPREAFVGLNKGQLRSTVCQRCHFLSAHNVALQVRVNPESYLDMLRPIKNKNALVLLMVDLMDAPCSIHPRIMDVIGHSQPIVVVGNKVDLLPMDGFDCLKRIKNAVAALLKRTCLVKANIKDICLISAQNGFGVEELITILQTNWQNKGDIYIVGSTNCGKSTLFNTLLGSDMCKIQAADLILRATTSPWPGTTLNMLRFPLLKPSGRRMQAREERLQEAHITAYQEFNESGNLTFNNQLATLTGTVERTFMRTDRSQADIVDVFSHPTTAPRFQEELFGIDETKPEYKDGRWCYDTPGALQPDQFISLLTHDELLDVLPRSSVIPETYKIKPGRSLFIAGLGRVDVLCIHHTEPQSIGRIKYNVVRLTLFRSAALPITVVPTVEASAFYREYLGHSLLHVPRGHQDRLKNWPPLKPTNVYIKGGNTKKAAADIVLSSAGFASVTVPEHSVCQLRLWTPGGRGAYVRQPAFLDNHVRLRGASSPRSIKYGPHILYKASVCYE